MYQYHTLPNGLRVVLSRTASRVLYSGVYINVGSRDETGADEGIAHFIEHSLFKGTTHRRAHHILNRIDGIGGELNAFTTKEETCLYATSLCEHLERCVELFADILFESNFPDAEIAKEKDVVIEEIESYNDSPAELIYDEFEERAFAGHSLAHNILGSRRNVRRFSPAHLRDRLNSCYTPDKMVLSVAGDVDFDRLIRLSERYFGKYAAGAVSTNRGGTPEVQVFEHRVHRRTHQTHLLLGCQAPGMYDRSKTAFSLLNNLLGGPAMNSRLNVAIRERYGFCYTIESQYVPFTDCGLFYVYAGVDHQAEERAVALIKDELQRVASEPLSDRQLLNAQRQFVGQMTINNDLGLNEMQSVGKAFLNFDKVDTIEEMSADVMALTSSALLSVAQDCFLPEKMSLLAYV